jgi:hypothetical protein
VTTAPAPASGEPLRRWAISAQASSQYGESSWAASQATGAPNTPQCGDETSAWAAATAGTLEWIQLDYGVPVQALQVNIIETYTPDQVVRVELLDTAGTYHQVYTGQPKTVTQCPYTLSISVDGADLKVVAVKITVDQSVSGQWNEIDAVELVGWP